MTQKLNMRADRLAPHSEVPLTEIRESIEINLHCYFSARKWYLLSS